LFVPSWGSFFLRPWRWDKQVIPKRWSYTYTKNCRRATTQKIFSNITTTAEAFNYISFRILSKWR
jgi:hypothetical protein